MMDETEYILSVFINWAEYDLKGSIFPLKFPLYWVVNH